MSLYIFFDVEATPQLTGSYNKCSAAFSFPIKLARAVKV